MALPLNRVKYHFVLRRRVLGLVIQGFVSAVSFQQKNNLNSAQIWHELHADEWPKPKENLLRYEFEW